MRLADGLYVAKSMRSHCADCPPRALGAKAVVAARAGKEHARTFHTGRHAGFGQHGLRLATLEHLLKMQGPLEHRIARCKRFHFSLYPPQHIATSPHASTRGRQAASQPSWP